DLAERLDHGSRFAELLEHYLVTLKDRLVTSWDRALKVKRLFFFRRHAARLPLSRVERLAIHDAQMHKALQVLREVVERSQNARRQRAQDFEWALGKWRTWCAGRSWLD